MDVSKGNYWIGHPGSLFPLKDYVGQLDIDEEDEPVFTPLLGGGRRVRVSRTRAARTWSVTIPGAHADEVSNLRTLLTGSMGPFVFVDPWAQVTNVLTPEQSVLKSTSPAISFGGSYPIADTGGTGFAMFARPNPAAAGGAVGSVRIGPAPIPPIWTYRKVTASAYLATARTAGAFVTLRWLDAAGNVVGSSVVGNAVTGLDGLRRSVATGTPPWGAVQCRVDTSYAEVIAQPAVTWTDEAMEWDAGNGALSVHATITGRSSEYAAPSDRSLRRHDLSFRVYEIGPMA